MSMCQPPLWAHPAQVVAIRSEWSGHSQLYPHCPHYHITFSILRAESSLWPLFYHNDMTSLIGGVGSCNHQHPRDVVFGVEETIVACKPRRPSWPWSVHCTTVSFPLTCAVHAVRIQHPRTEFCLTTQHHLGAGGSNTPHPSPLRPPHWANFSPGLQPIKNYFWCLLRKSV